MYFNDCQKNKNLLLICSKLMRFWNIMICEKWERLKKKTVNPLWFQLYKFVEQWNPFCGDCYRLNICCCLVGKSYLTFCDLWTIASQASLSMAFSRQEYWSGLPFPSPEDLSDPGIESTSAWQVDYLPLSHLGRPRLFMFS